MKALFQQDFCPLQILSNFFKTLLSHLGALATPTKYILQT